MVTQSPKVWLWKYFNVDVNFWVFLSLSSTVLHTGKRWFIICPVAETPMQDKENTLSHTPAVHGMPHTQYNEFFYAFRFTHF